MNSESKLKAALNNNLIDGIIITNEKGGIESANSAAEQLFGYEVSQLTGQEFKILFLDQNEAELKNLAGHRQIVTGRKKGGDAFSFLLAVSETKINNSLFYACLVHETPAEKKQQEEDLQKYISELERSNQELRDFAHVSSHDLQEPLRKIQAFGERLKMKEFDKLSEDGKDYINRMLSATERMQHLINGLLSFTRITSRANAFENIKLNTILKEVLSDLEISIEKSGATITYNDLPDIEGDPTQLRQIFQNLISNAIKFRKDHQSPIIHISATKTDNFIELSIEDNGIGFDEKYAEKVFGIFQRLEGHKYEGSGIGLAICRKIAIRHGGDIIVKSQPEKGSVFIVKLPLKQTR